MSSFSRDLLLVIGGFIPSIFWLLYYLKKDCHPEPKSLIAKTMALGILIAPLAIVAQLLFTRLARAYFPNYEPTTAISFFLWAALVEEYVKYLVVRLTVLNRPEFDEPTDAMVYMISAALGFAAIENILVLFNVIPDGPGAALRILVLRFVGATLLHTIASAALGYCLGLAWFYHHHSRKIIAGGLALATLTHLVFNLAMLNTDRGWGLLVTSGGLLILIILISFLFDRFRDRVAVHS